MWLNVGAEYVNRIIYVGRYVSAVDKALKNFEYTSEWADLISALGKLNKVSTIIVYELNTSNFWHSECCIPEVSETDVGKELISFIFFIGVVKSYEISCYSTSHKNK